MKATDDDILNILTRGSSSPQKKRGKPKPKQSPQKEVVPSKKKGTPSSSDGTFGLAVRFWDIDNVILNWVMTD